MAAIWVGIDDTDSPEGGCTTWVLTELLRAAREVGIDLLGEPRLVRLNPNIPWKTRGNAALAARFGRGIGPPQLVGEVDGRPLRSYLRGASPDAGLRERFVAAAWETVERHSHRAPTTDPALVVTSGPLPAALYWKAVREVLPIEEVREALTARNAVVRLRDGARGIVGAAAAIAWPGRRATWELLAYRAPEQYGTRRQVDAKSVLSTADRHPELFLCHDPRTRRLLVAPHTPCPILFGLRSRSRSPLLEARREVRSEPVDRWVVFRTNQGTGDHLVRRTGRELAPYLSAEVDGVVAEAPRTEPGGHVRFVLEDPEGTAVACVAFEPTKTLPRVARALAAGDRLRVWGSVGRARSLRVEGIRVVRLAPQTSQKSPRCPHCARPSASRGRMRGYRCPSCRRRWAPEAAARHAIARSIAPGEFHPTPSARRHLARRGPEP